jgi:hypothetical protein
MKRTAKSKPTPSTAWLHIRLTPRDKKQVELAAVTVGKTVSAYARDVLVSQ